MRDYIEIGPTPYDEPCVQLGVEDYQKLARVECNRFLEQLRRQFGPEPGAAQLAVKSNPHDFGSYLSVVCYYDPDDEASTQYAFNIEANTPALWDDGPAEGGPEAPLQNSDEDLGMPIYPGSTSCVSVNIQVCDFCANNEAAVVDGRTKMGPWAGMCVRHFQEYGIGLGTGYGQRLRRESVR